MFESNRLKLILSIDFLQTSSKSRKSYQTLKLTKKIRALRGSNSQDGGVCKHYECFITARNLGFRWLHAPGGPDM